MNAKKNSWNEGNYQPEKNGQRPEQTNSNPVKYLKKMLFGTPSSGHTEQLQNGKPLKIN